MQTNKSKMSLAAGEELTFDYASVTESEKEFKEAICLCSTHQCRGSYLTFTGSRAFMQVMSSRHNFLHRQVGLNGSFLSHAFVFGFLLPYAFANGCVGACAI